MTPCSPDVELNFKNSMVRGSFANTIVNDKPSSTKVYLKKKIHIR